MSEKEFKNNRPKSDEKDLEGLVQNFSQKVEPATKKVKKTVGKIGRQGMHAAEHYTGDDYTMRGAMVLATCGMAVNNAIDKAVEKNPQVKDITDDMMKTAVFKDMVMDYVEDFKGFISDIENTIDQLDKSTVEKVIDDVSGRMINAYGDKKERLEEVQKAADEYVKGDKMDLNQDEISYDDDDDHDDH